MCLVSKLFGARPTLSWSVGWHKKNVWKIVIYQFVVQPCRTKDRRDKLVRKSIPASNALPFAWQFEITLYRHGWLENIESWLGDWKQPVQCVCNMSLLFFVSLSLCRASESLGTLISSGDTRQSGRICLDLRTRVAFQHVMTAVHSKQHMKTLWTLNC